MEVVFTKATAGENGIEHGFLTFSALFCNRDMFGIGGSAL